MLKGSPSHSHTGFSAVFTFSHRDFYDMTDEEGGSKLTEYYMKYFGHDDIECDFEDDSEVGQCSIQKFMRK